MGRPGRRKSASSLSSTRLSHWSRCAIGHPASRGALKRSLLSACSVFSAVNNPCNPRVPRSGTRAKNSLRLSAWVCGEMGGSSLGKGPEEGDEFFSLSGRDVHKIQTNIELMFPLALELVVPEHLGFNGPRVPLTRGR